MSCCYSVKSLKRMQESERPSPTARSSSVSYPQDLGCNGKLIAAGMLKACDLLPRKLLVTAIKAIKHLSTSPQLIEVLQNSNATEILVRLLAETARGAHCNVSYSFYQLGLFLLIIAGDLLAHIPNNLLNVPTLQSKTRGSGIERNHPFAQTCHSQEIATQAICFTDSVRSGQCGQGEPTAAVA